MTSVPLPDAIKDLIERIRKQPDWRPGDMVRMIRDAEIQEENLLPWADFDHPTGDSYGRKMLYDGGNFEIMVMSWAPGDISAIHDHGYTEWGAVQIFGRAEHATFIIEGEHLITQHRWMVKPGDILGVTHEMIHQMGNPNNHERFLSLHVYGLREKVAAVTANARIYDVDHGEIFRVDGGVFYCLPEHEIKERSPGPAGDFPTCLMNATEKAARWLRMRPDHPNMDYSGSLYDIRKACFTSQLAPVMLNFLGEISDADGFVQDSVYWDILRWELQRAHSLQSQQEEKTIEDPFYQYAERYDALIGQPCLNQFIAQYLQSLGDIHNIQWNYSKVLSIGCGTGIVELYMIDQLHVEREHLLGMDISPAMVAQAQHRIRAQVGDIRSWKPKGDCRYDLLYTGLNVLHYLPLSDLESAIENMANQLVTGGVFIGDFITPDHIRQYPHVVISDDKAHISLRNPKLIEQAGRSYMSSDIINVHFSKEMMSIEAAGTHQRSLPPMSEIRAMFSNYFSSEVVLYDAYSMERIADHADTCPSSRYVIYAVKR